MPWEKALTFMGWWCWFVTWPDRRLSAGSSLILRWRIWIFFIKSDRNQGGRSRADDGPSSALPGLFGGDRDPWRWQWVVTVKRLCPPCEFHGGAVKGWLDCAQYSHADCCRRNAQGGNKWVLVRKHQPKLVVCYPPLFPMKLTGILEHSH